MIPTETWVLPRPRKNRYKGGFPLHFEKKLWKLLGCPEKVLHPFGGQAEIGDKVDINPEVNPKWVGDAHNLNMISDNSYDLVILDPPYDNQQADKLYKTPRLNYKKYVSEAMRVCKIGGMVAIYHWVWTPRPKDGKYYYRIIVLTRVWHRPRVCNVYLKEKEDELDT